jgi:hypothetical protein
MATATKSRRHRTTKITKASKPVTTAKAPKPISLFQGTVAATKVFNRTMPQFKNCKATCWLLFNEIDHTVTFGNSYNGDTPKASYDPKTYTYEYNPKVHDPKMAGMTEVEVDEWPQWIISAHATRRRRASK